MLADDPLRPFRNQVLMLLLQLVAPGCSETQLHTCIASVPLPYLLLQLLLLSLPHLQLPAPAAAALWPRALWPTRVPFANPRQTQTLMRRLAHLLRP